MRVLFAGTPPIAVPSLEAVAASPHDVVGVLTAPDRPGGRGRELQPSAVKSRARELGLPVVAFDRLGSAARADVRALEPQLLACFAYGRIFGPRFLELFAFGALNVHPSLLPRHRGPAPIPAAILAGDCETGVTVQGVAREMDAGDIYAQERIPLAADETSESLGRRVAPIGARMLVEVIDAIADGTASAVPQDHSLATYTSVVRKQDGRIDWTLPAVQIDRMVRAYTPWPRAYTTLRGEHLAVLDAQPLSRSGGARPGTVVRVDTARGILVETGNGLLALRKLQLQSRRPLDWRSFQNGVPDLVGVVLGGS